MKNYDETINSVFERINEYEVEKKHKRKIITRTVTSLCCFCLVALLGIGVWQSDLFKSMPPTVLGGNNSSLQGTDKTDEGNSNNNESSSVIPDASVIWGNANDEPEDMGYIEWNGKNVSSSLYDVLSSERSNNSLIAIGVEFELDNKFVYNGKSIAEYAIEADNERLRYDKLGQLLKLGDSLKYGEALYKTGTPIGEKWTKELYEETVETIGKDLIEKYIVNGEFLKEKLESDIANYDGFEPCCIAYETACEAYYKIVIKAAVEQLDKQSIKYEKRNETELILYTTADNFSVLSLNKVMCFGLATKNADKGVDYENTFIDDVI